MLPWIWASFMIHDDPSSARVVRPYLIGDELVGDGIPTRFVIDIAAEDVMTAAAMAPAAFRRIHDLVLPERQAAADQEQQCNREALARHPEARVNRHHEQFLSTWWQLSWRRPTMIAALFRLPRDIALSAHASRAPPARVTFVSSEIHLSNGTFVSGLADDYSFGILQSAAHLDWFRERCSRLKHARATPARPSSTASPGPRRQHRPWSTGSWKWWPELLAFRAERMVQGITFANSTTRCASPAAAGSATSTRHSTGLCWTCTGSTPARTYSPRSSN